MPTDAKIYVPRVQNAVPKLVEERRKQPGRRSTDGNKDTHEKHLYVMVLIGVVGIFLFAIQADGLANFANVMGTAALVGGAALLVGGLLGFLFGIPRSAADDSTSSGNAGNRDEPRSKYHANTNLEQISDWLTKILVGVGLTQIGKIGKELNVLGGVLSSGLGGNSAHVFAVSLVIYYGICGFLYGYLWSRLRLMGAMMHADLKARVERAEQVGLRAVRASLEFKKDVNDQREADAIAYSLVSRQLEPIPGLPPVSQDELNQAVAGASPAYKVQFFHMARRVRNAASGSPDQKRRIEWTIPVFRALIASDPEDRFHRNHAQLGYALKDQRMPSWKEAEQALTKAIEIRNRANDPGYPYYELNRAVCRIRLDLALPGRRRCEEPLRSAIVEDLRASVAAKATSETVKTDESINQWLEVNNIGHADLASADCEMQGS